MRKTPGVAPDEVIKGVTPKRAFGISGDVLGLIRSLFSFWLKKTE